MSDIKPVIAAIDRLTSAVESVCSKIEDLTLKLDDVESAIERQTSMIGEIDTDAIVSALGDVDGTLTAMDGTLSTLS